MFYIFTSENITFSKYAFYFINNSLYFITLYIIFFHYLFSYQVVGALSRRHIRFPKFWSVKTWTGIWDINK